MNITAHDLAIVIQTLFTLIYIGIAYILRRKFNTHWVLTGKDEPRNKDAKTISKISFGYFMLTFSGLLIAFTLAAVVSPSFPEPIGKITYIILPKETWGVTLMFSYIILGTIWVSSDKELTIPDYKLFISDRSKSEAE